MVSKSLAEEYFKNFQKQRSYLIIRTSWVIGPVYKNFLTTMIVCKKEIKLK